MKLSHFSFTTGSFLLLSVFTFGCAHLPSAQKSDPKFLFSQACEIGAGNKEVKGSLWLKAKSKEASGQFPASVIARAPDQLRLEITNLVGGTEAIIQIDGQKYKVEGVRTKMKKQENSSGYWGGIPLQWANDLFLGKIPCPSKSDFDAATRSVTPEGDLILITQASLGSDAEKFIYRFKSSAGKPWPESLHWERLGTIPLGVDFTFQDPDDATKSPKKWEAKSLSGHGEVKVRWKDREVSR